MGRNIAHREMTPCLRQWLKEHGTWGVDLWMALTSPSGGTFDEGELIRTLEAVTSIHRIYQQGARHRALNGLAGLLTENRGPEFDAGEVLQGLRSPILDVQYRKEGWTPDG